MLPSAVAFLHEGFGFFEVFPGVDEYFKVAGSPVADPADVAGDWINIINKNRRLLFTDNATKIIAGV